MATIGTSVNSPSSHFQHVCDLCWEGFDSADELARHVDEEEWTLYPLAVE